MIRSINKFEKSARRSAAGSFLIGKVPEIREITFLDANVCIMNKLGKQLKAYRLQHDLSREDVALMLNIPVGLYEEMESDIAETSLKHLLTLCRYYDIKPDVWLNYSPEAVETPPVITEPVPVNEESIPAGELVFEDEEEDDDFPSLYNLDRSKRTINAKEVIETYKKQGTELSEEDAEKISDFMYQMAQISLKQAMRQVRRDNKLERYPKGYPLSGKSFTCWLCHHGGDGRMWYDRFGLKCMPCQHAVEQGIVPGEITQDDTLFYSEFDLEHYFSLKGKALREWIKKGLLKPRTITRENGKSKHYQVFLMSEHEGFLPPIKMMRIGGLVEDEEDGKKFYRSSQWYEHVDPFEYLKDYGIIKYMKYKETPQKEDEKKDELNLEE
ncbi:helix-turn-helix transcriptional regulator [Mucilaginibacter sp. dw_454]|uniref:helix-turn-helix domain-containing protein n=1 Tax=Mucilaginibacter sp. dw_454 TaxID=2720079 RepID=UPI001BD42A5C|nr:helix-turn-helix transcriptional regulator [Mucilaginibacter sp. dw_454]